ncbi:MAG TPA: hypothetical protein VFB38_01520 [Chthonomonadaceae bacterium]|nr:hypothetical protein [Chthonomonadaceae bacterium]
MAEPQVLEGTWEEIKLHEEELKGRKVKVIIEEPSSSRQERPFYETATPEEWERAFLEWTEGHNTLTPLLPSEAFERESIYEDSF